MYIQTIISLLVSAPKFIYTADVNAGISNWKSYHCAGVSSTNGSKHDEVDECDADVSVNSWGSSNPSSRSSYTDGINWLLSSPFCSDNLVVFCAPYFSWSESPWIPPQIVSLHAGLLLHVHRFYYTPEFLRYSIHENYCSLVWSQCTSHSVLKTSMHLHSSWVSIEQYLLENWWLLLRSVGLPSIASFFVWPTTLWTRLS